jgi:predicted nuclease of restriction endonuclease-like (RecB) superfamily
MNKETDKGELDVYGSFIKEIKDLVYSRQYEAMKAVNAELIQLYWEIGRKITHQQLEKGWGMSVVRVLAKELQKEFPGTRGFSARNLWRMRNFYVEYSENPILQSSTAVLEKPIVPPSVSLLEKPILQSSIAVLETPILQSSIAVLEKPILPTSLAEISWTKNMIIMQKCKDSSERDFYIKMTKCYGWTTNVLINNIENKAYKRFLSNQTNFDETVSEKYRIQAKLAVKDDYNFDFIEMGTEHSEAELEAGVMKNIRAFLLEMGGDFGFIGNQYHLDAADEDHYIDLLLYHRRLRCLVVIELKIGEFKPEYAGKMQFYLTAVDETMKLPDENPTLGIIICKNKNRTKVEYTLRSSNRPIGVATYSFYEDLPEEVRSVLPSPDRIADIVRGMDFKEEDL